MEELVSVVVPVYNVDKFLDRCVGSIVSQTYSNLEIILVDDGSTDLSPEMCDEWSRKDFRVTAVHKQNAGAGFARNTGIDAAKGRYILFVDSDDYIAPETIERCVTELKKTRADFVMFGRFNVTADGKVDEKPIVSDKYFFQGEQVLTDILPGLFTYERGSGISTCCKMYNLDLIKQTGVRYKSEREVLSEDAFFNLELFRYIKAVSIIPYSLYYYFKNEKSLSRSYRKDLQKLNDTFLEKSLALCSEAGYPQRVVNYIKARYHIYAFGGMKQIQGGDFSKENKKQLLNLYFKNDTLHNTVTLDVLKLETVPLRIFFLCLKAGLYGACRFLLNFTG